MINAVQSPSINYSVQALSRKAAPQKVEQPKPQEPKVQGPATEESFKTSNKVQDLMKKYSPVGVQVNKSGMSNEKPFKTSNKVEELDKQNQVSDNMRSVIMNQYQAFQQNEITPEKMAAGFDKMM